MHLSDLAASDAADAVTTLVNAGGAGSIQLWSGAMPGTTSEVPAGSLLAEISYVDPAFDPASAGVAVGREMPRSSVGLAAAGSGTDVEFYRVVSGAGDTIWQSDVVSTSGSSGLVLNTLSVSEGVTVEITEHTYTQPTT